MSDAPAKPNVVSLRGGEIPQPGKSLPTVVAEAERILELALSGEIQGIAAVLTHSDECTTSNLVGVVLRATLGSAHLLAADIVDHLKGDR